MFELVVVIQLAGATAIERYRLKTHQWPTKEACETYVKSPEAWLDVMQLLAQVSPDGGAKLATSCELVNGA